MDKQITHNSRLSTELGKKIAIIRLIFGAVWAIDAFFKFDPTVYNNILSLIKDAGSGQPSWLSPWFNFWYGVVGFNQSAAGTALIVIESLIALLLLLGVARRLTYVAASVFCFLIWSVGEGFGGPYGPGSTDIGASVIYIFVFALLFIIDGVLPPTWSLDAIIATHISWWSKIAGPTTSPKRID
jgi:thiosulfate dehydrogenase [quinone] large subunit